MKQEPSLEDIAIATYGLDCTQNELLKIQRDNARNALNITHDLYSATIGKLDASEARVQLLAKALLSLRNKLPSGAFDAEVADIDAALQEAGQPIA
jgi:hypothetical protein